MRAQKGSMSRIGRPRLAMGALLLGVVVIAAACSSGSSASTTTTARTSASTGTGPAVVHTAVVGSLGTVLVSSSGLTLYRYTPDGTGKSVCTGTCASIWPPLLVPTSTTHVGAGSGVAAANLGTIVRSDGTRQVTFKGMPLYTYKGDSNPGKATGQGLDGTWYVVSPTGSVSASASSSTTTPSSGGSGF
jgi:predicted lipoprotein with Yx(FWY)xxD motif